ncbi:phosphoribosylglycinamide formyltransferase [Sphingobacterium spiritivorum ATCC 33300]|uniref:Phosphoribosylglycinamide formyltransferase n=2 Tax=Sphingobacterium spiritivorum TaxID=258 RepID=D7VPG8_SPHSI|nr:MULTISPECIES: phosphoribosylglycinamide formyltransferase [Sphingobacterium]EEI92146.1 phosphoribosylglycinamide formyltransferase [Sphingobacterium spiritivorum ATCC 33300]EFK57815.1 phosphoribosylglycinamide formyltransferase [Sphingobacterium spiritivorum ATCC 33861]QQS96597.1 phosphoribosylglycinamide formyltransferase [Sphingobacterium spiritivorum]QQT36156.1 phosphoribosylglycinamide formyltransferase [Sphingobacterium spiritivorum]WQD32893.1 phosphoribosylglycinamide formyltransferas
MKKRIAIFASGSGSNAQKIMEHFKYSDTAEVALILSNNPESYVLQRADNFEIPSHVFDRHDFFQTDDIVKLLKNLNIDLIVLAGFLWLVPENLLKAFPNKIINIHPALLPKFGGKGMYGDRVHKAILEAKESEHGITIHFVNEHFDEGEVIYQAKFKVESGDTLEIIKFKGQQLEHLHYPKVIENLLKKYN